MTSMRHLDFEERTEFLRCKVRALNAARERVVTIGSLLLHQAEREAEAASTAYRDLKAEYAELLLRKLENPEFRFGYVLPVTYQAETVGNVKFLGVNQSLHAAVEPTLYEMIRCVLDAGTDWGDRFRVHVSFGKAVVPAGFSVADSTMLFREGATPLGNFWGTMDEYFPRDLFESLGSFPPIRRVIREYEGLTAGDAVAVTRQQMLEDPWSIIYC